MLTIGNNFKVESGVAHVYDKTTAYAALPNSATNFLEFWEINLETGEQSLLTKLGQAKGIQSGSFAVSSSHLSIVDGQGFFHVYALQDGNLETFEVRPGVAHVYDKTTAYAAFPNSATNFLEFWEINLETGEQSLLTKLGQAKGIQSGSFAVSSSHLSIVDGQGFFHVYALQDGNLETFEVRPGVAHVYDKTTAYAAFPNSATNFLEFWEINLETGEQSLLTKLGQAKGIQSGSFAVSLSHLSIVDGQGFLYAFEFIKPPHDLHLSTANFDENIAGGSTVASLSTSDDDSGDTHTYALVNGSGDIDNSAFTVNGNQLSIKDLPDFETQPSYSIRLQTKDSSGLTFEKSVTLAVNDVDDTPVIAGGGGGEVGGGESSSRGGGGSSSAISESTATPEAIIAPAETPIGEPTTTTPQAATSETQNQVIDGTIQSIDIEGIQLIKVSTFALIKPIQVGKDKVETLIAGTKKKDKITGTSEGEVLAGEGKDILSGGEGADGFVFQNPEGFGKKEADKITDFDAVEGD